MEYLKRGIRVSYTGFALILVSPILYFTLKYLLSGFTLMAMILAMAMAVAGIVVSIIGMRMIRSAKHSTVSTKQAKLCE